jgi:amidase
LLNAIRGVDENDPQTQAAAALEDVDFRTYLQADALRGKRIGVLKRDSLPKEGQGVILSQAMETMRDAGAEVIEIEPLQIEFNFITYFFAMHRGVNEYLQAIGSDLTLEQIVAFNNEDLANRAPFQQGLLELCVKTPLDPATEGAYEALHQANYDSATNGTRNALKEHNLDALVDVNNWSTYAYAPNGFPAVCVPAGYLSDGEPMGITFWGDYLQDGDLIALGYAFEQAAQVWQPPTPILPSES